MNTQVTRFEFGRENSLNFSNPIESRRVTFISRAYTYCLYNSHNAV